jgi:hypothetical protein
LLVSQRLPAITIGQGRWTRRKARRERLAAAQVAAALDGREEIGDGFVARVCAEVQRRLWHPPLEDAADMSRWR